MIYINDTLNKQALQLNTASVQFTFIDGQLLSNLTDVHLVGVILGRILVESQIRRSSEP